MFGEFVIENGSEEDVSFPPPCGDHESGLYRLGQPVGGGAREGISCPAVSRPPVVVPPGGTHRARLTFHAIARRGQPDGRYLLAPGTYQAAAAIPSPEGDGYWFTPAVDVTIPDVRPLPAETGDGGLTFKPPSGVRVVLEVSRRRVAVGESLPAVLVVENGSSAPFRFHATCRTPAWGLYREGRWMGGRSEYVNGEVAPGCESPPMTTLAPGERFTREFSFDTTGRYNFSAGRHEQVEPGRYQAAAGVRQAEGDGEFTHWFWFAAPVEIDVR